MVAKERGAPYVRSAMMSPMRLKKDLQILKILEAPNEIDLYYFDTSGFSLVPNVPYAWQKKGETLELDSAKSKSTNVLGFLKRETRFGPIRSMVRLLVLSWWRSFNISFKP